MSIEHPTFSTTLKASPQDGDPQGKSSRFVGSHEKLGVVKDYEGALSGVV